MAQKSFDYALHLLCNQQRWHYLSQLTEDIDNKQLLKLSPTVLEINLHSSEKMSHIKNLHIEQTQRSKLKIKTLNIQFQF